MHNGFLLQIVSNLNKHKEQFSNQRPVSIRINEQWLNHEISMGNIFTEITYIKETIPKQLGGIPVTYDSTVDKYELIYEDRSE